MATFTLPYPRLTDTGLNDAGKMNRIFDAISGMFTGNFDASFGALSSVTLNVSGLTTLANLTVTGTALIPHGVTQNTLAMGGNVAKTTWADSLLTQSGTIINSSGILRAATAIQVGAGTLDSSYKFLALSVDTEDVNMLLQATVPTRRATIQLVSTNISVGHLISEHRGGSYADTEWGYNNANMSSIKALCSCFQVGTKVATDLVFGTNNLKRVVIDGTGIVNQYSNFTGSAHLIRLITAGSDVGVDHQITDYCPTDAWMQILCAGQGSPGSGGSYGGTILRGFAASQYSNITSALEFDAFSRIAPSAATPQMLFKVAKKDGANGITAIGSTLIGFKWQDNTSSLMTLNCAGSLALPAMTAAGIVINNASGVLSTKALGTANRLAKFDSTGVVGSTVSDDGTTVTVNAGNLTVNGGLYAYRGASDDMLNLSTTRNIVGLSAINIYTNRTGAANGDTVSTYHFSRSSTTDNAAYAWHGYKVWDITHGAVINGYTWNTMDGGAIAEAMSLRGKNLTVTGNLTVSGSIFRIDGNTTPTGTGDTSGSPGDIVMDDTYIYYKNSSGYWRRVVVESW